MTSEMLLPNKLHLRDLTALEEAEEKICKVKAVRLHTEGVLDALPVGTFAMLAAIHRYLFEDIYEFAGRVRTEELAKGGILFAASHFLPVNLRAIDAMPHDSFDAIVKKYVEMNVAHPFREGNGRSTRLWLDALFKSGLRMVVDWRRIPRADYMDAMRTSPFDDAPIRALLHRALTTDVDDFELFLDGVDVSFRYEQLDAFPVRTLL